MSTVASDRPAGGGKCPRCRNGVLILIAETETGDYLACFNCDTRGTVPREGEWQRAVDPATTSPTGFQVTHEQAAAQDAGSDPEQAAARAHTAARADELQGTVAAQDERIAALTAQLDRARSQGFNPDDQGGG